MTKDISDIMKTLAAKYSGNQVEEKKPEPTRPAPREYTYEAPRRSVFEDKSIVSRGGTHRASGLRNDELGYLERGAMERSTKVPDASKKPDRPPYTLGDVDWLELEELPMHKGMTFDKWLAEACIPLLVENYDPDYNRASRLYLMRKRDLHRGGGS